MTWPTKPLSELAEISRGSSPRPIADQRFFEGGTIPWVKIADATKSGKFLYQTKEHVNDFGASFSRRLPAGTILVAASGTLGYTQILGVEGCAHDGWLILQNLRKLDRDFAYYALKTLERHFYNSAYGAAIQNINTEILRRTQIPYPPLQLQRRIGNILSAYDDLIEVNQRRVALLEETARRLFERWFFQFRFPGSERRPIIDKPEGRLPKNWRISKLSKVTEFIRGRSYRSSELVDVGGMPFVNLKCFLRGGGFNEAGLKRYSGTYNPNQLLQSGDIVIAVTDMTQERRIVGQAARIQKLDELPAVHSMDVVKVTPLSDLSNAYLYHWLRFSDFSARAAQRANGVNVLHLSPSAIADFSIVVPDWDTQMTFERKVGPITDQCDLLLATEKRLVAAREHLLPRLISGELPITIAERELEAVA